MESRRSFIGKVGAVAASAAILAVAKPAKAEIPADRRGYFKAGSDRFMPDGCHVYLNGSRIDCICSEFDTDRGWAKCYRDYEGDPSIDHSPYDGISIKSYWFDENGKQVMPCGIKNQGWIDGTERANGKKMGWKIVEREHYLYGKVEVR